MALKSYSFKSMKKKKKRKSSSSSDILRAGAGAVIGVAFVSTLANIIN